MLKVELGFSLTELMIASVLGLIVTAAALQLYLTQLRASGDSLRLSRLNHELHASLDLLTTELRRSGYWAGEPGLDAVTDNPFQRPENDLRRGQHPDESAHSCLLYSYDLNADKRVGVGPSGRAAVQTSHANLEQFGLRLRHAQLQLRNGGPRFDCETGSWQSISDPDTEVTRLEFEIFSRCFNLTLQSQACRSGDAAVLQRRVRVRLAAHSRSDPSVRQQLSTQINLENDKLYASYP